MIRAVDRLSRMYLQLPKATRLCGVVILLSRGEFGRERNKISYQRGCAWTFCYVSNLWCDIVMVQQIFSQ